MIGLEHVGHTVFDGEQWISRDVNEISRKKLGRRMYIVKRPASRGEPLSRINLQKSTMETKPVIYILHGSWHSPLFFESARRKFELLGYTVICPQQPSTGAVPPTNTLYDDADLVRAELELLIEHGQDVVLVMHSYGGMVGTQAAAGLGKAEREKRGQAGGVARLFYACSFILPLGHHLCTAIGGELAPFIQSKVSLDDACCTWWMGLIYRL